MTDAFPVRSRQHIKNLSVTVNIYKFTVTFILSPIYPGQISYYIQAIDSGFIEKI